MSRGPGKVQRFVLAELQAPTPAGEWPPWITVETLAARYAGLARGELVAVRDDDGLWRPAAALQTTTAAKDHHLIGLRVESTSSGTWTQRIGRARIESVRRAVKALAAAGRIDMAWHDQASRGRRYEWYGDDRNSAPWVHRGRVHMLTCRRLLTDAELEIQRPRAEKQRRERQALMAMLGGGR